MVLGIMVGLASYIFNQMASILTTLNDWPPLLAAAAPLVLFMLVAVVMIAWKEYAYRAARLI